MPRLIFFLAILVTFTGGQSMERPNILWITSEDNGPYLGCYGDPVARTPHLDALAEESSRFLNCFSNAAVCAPARQTLITGMYSTSLGGQHMRSKVTFPQGVRFFPEYLRLAGYYTSNNSKTDYNGGPEDGKAAMQAAWNESGSKAHWRKKPSPDTPFFAVFNLTDSHESRLFPDRWKKRELVTDPASVILPAHLPDLPEIRLDMARYYDCLETMDEKAGAILDQLEADGLRENTIVFYFSDHGGSMPRGKSFTYDSGTRVPLLIRIPNKWAHLRPTVPGATSDRLVSFVDFAPTLLSIIGWDIPSHMQGLAFLGDRQGRPRDFVHTFRARRGERYDIVRGVRSAEFLYLRNYTPHLPVMQFNAYSFGIPGYSAWRETCARGDCNSLQSQWFAPKASEELYHVGDDPDNVTNLADDPALAEVLKSHRRENDRHLGAIRDSVFYPEGMNGREFSTYQDEETYPMEGLIPLANAVSKRNSENLPSFERAMENENACVRYWGITGCVVLGEAALPARDSLVKRLEDEEPVNRLQAARALAGMGETDSALPVIREFTARAPSEELALQAVLAIDECGLLETDPGLKALLPKARGSYTKRVVEKLLEY